MCAACSWRGRATTHTQLNSSVERRDLCASLRGLSIDSIDRIGSAARRPALVLLNSNLERGNPEGGGGCFRLGRGPHTLYPPFIPGYRGGGCYSADDRQHCPQWMPARQRDECPKPTAAVPRSSRLNSSHTLNTPSPPASVSQLLGALGSFRQQIERFALV